MIGAESRDGARFANAEPRLLASPGQCGAQAPAAQGARRARRARIGRSIWGGAGASPRPAALRRFLLSAFAGGDPLHAFRFGSAVLLGSSAPEGRGAPKSKERRKPGSGSEKSSTRAAEWESACEPPPNADGDFAGGDAPPQTATCPRLRRTPSPDTHRRGNLPSSYSFPPTDSTRRRLEASLTFQS